MKKKLSRIVSFLICFILIIDPVLSVQAIQQEAYILNDAFVSNFNNQSDNVMINQKSDTLIIGKGRHAYMRFDLSTINVDEIENISLNVTKKNGANNIVLRQCDEYLNNNESLKWDENNITYNNRPDDLEDSPTFYQEVKSGEFNLKLDLTELLLDAKYDGKDIISIHIYTESVDDSAVPASEFYSTRSNKIPTIDISVKNSEIPVELKASKKIGDYLDNGSISQMIFKMKINNYEYLTLKEDGESIGITNKSDKASKFALYIYQYEKDYNESYGATKTTYAIKCLENNKYLTIQNYFLENDKNKSYYNLVDGNSSIYEIKAAANEVNWNERFYIDYYEESDYYTISSHLNTLRDDPSFKTTPIRINKDILCSNKANNSIYKFEFEEVSECEQLEIRQEVSGNNAKLYWYPVNDDIDLGNYIVEGSTVNYDSNSGVMYANVDNLEVGNNIIEVKYSCGDNKQKYTTNVRIFNHLGLSHTEKELDLMKERIKNKLEPWYSDYQKLIYTVPSNMSNSDFKTIFHEGVGRGNPSGSGNIGDFEQSANAAYFNALQWVITGEDDYAETVVKILNGWANNLKIVDGRDRILGAAISSFKFNNAAEIIKYYKGGYKGYSDIDFKKYQDMMINVVYPVIQDLGAPMIANGNWDTAAMISMISIGVLCDNTEIFDRAINLYQDNHINGSISVYVSDWGQSVESARDQAHAQLGIGYMADVCQVAINQGINLYSLYDNRLAKAFNWAAKYNLFEDDVKFEPLMNVFGDANRGYWTVLDSEKINRGELRPVYEVPLAYYSNIEGVDVTWIKKAAEAMRAQGYVHNDNLNFGTLTSYNANNTNVAEQYFQLRTRLEPWYQRTLKAVEDYRDESSQGLDETLNSYFDISENGELIASSKKYTAPFFRLENNQDGTYSIRCIKNNRYLSVKDEMIGNQNVIKVDAENIGENEKFIFQCNGASFYYLRSPKYDNRIVYINVDGSESDPKNATLTIRLGESSTFVNSDVTNNEKFIIMYNTKEIALNSIELADTTELEELISKVSSLNNEDNKYTVESYKTFEQALKLAKEGVINAKEGKIFKENIDKLLYHLNKAHNDLVENKVEDDDSVEDKPGNGDTDIEIKPDNGGNNLGANSNESINTDKKEPNLPKTGGVSGIAVGAFGLMVVATGLKLSKRNKN